MNNIPKIKNVEAIDDYRLIVQFDNNAKREYDCEQILHHMAFKPLVNKAFFRSVKVDIGGHGISWNEDIDLSEYELWINGKEI